MKQLAHFRNRTLLILIDEIVCNSYYRLVFKINITKEGVAECENRDHLLLKLLSRGKPSTISTPFPKVPMTKWGTILPYLPRVANEFVRLIYRAMGDGLWEGAQVTLK